MEKTEKLRKIKEEVINLKESPLYKFRKEEKSFPVIGEGNHDAKIMFIGEAPGRREAATGRPFCGSAGKILTELLKEIGIEREEVYITNILKDRPPGNRDPLFEEIELYAPFLERQIEIIKPSLIVPLGRFAAKYILEKHSLCPDPFSILQIHGIVYKPKVHYKLKIIPLLHPAVAVYDRNKISLLREGFKKIKKEGGEKLE